MESFLAILASSPEALESVATMMDEVVFGHLIRRGRRVQ
jgi:hypothetical protein